MILFKYIVFLNFLNDLFFVYKFFVMVNIKFSIDLLVNYFVIFGFGFFDFLFVFVKL